MGIYEPAEQGSVKRRVPFLPFNGRIKGNSFYDCAAQMNIKAYGRALVAHTTMIIYTYLYLHRHCTAPAVINLGTICRSVDRPV